MPSVYNYRHVELDKVGRGKRTARLEAPEICNSGALKCPGQASNANLNEQAGGYGSSASSQAGSDVANSRIHIETDQQSVASSQTPVDGIIKQQQQLVGSGQMSPTGSVGSSLASGAASSLVGEAFQPVGMPVPAATAAAAAAAAAANQQLTMQDATRTPKKTIPVLRRNPITGEILENPAGRQQPVVRVRQPPGGHSSGIF